MKFFSRSILPVILFIISTQFIIASPPDWEDNPSAYEFTATISGGVVLNDGEQLGDDCDLFAAFDADGNVRGIALQLSPPFGPYQGTPVFEMQMRSNAEGDHLTFKYYDASEDAVLDISEDYTFAINDIIGDVTDPWIMNVGVPDLSCPECTDDDAAMIAFGGCAGAVAALQRAKDQHLIGHVGVTGSDPAVVARAIETDVFETALIWGSFHLLDQEIAERTLDLAAQRNMGVVVGWRILSVDDDPVI